MVKNNRKLLYFLKTNVNQKGTYKCNFWVMSKNFLEVVMTIYGNLILIPLAISLIGNPVGLGAFTVVSTAIVSDEFVCFSAKKT